MIATPLLLRPLAIGRVLVGGPALVLLACSGAG